MKEDIIQQQIIGYLSAISRRYNFIYFAPLPESTMTAMTRARASVKDKSIMKSFMSKMGFIPGVSDILIMQNGKVFCMELKQKDTDTKKFTQQKDQILFQQNCIRCDIPYEIARSLKQCQELLYMWGILD